LRKAFAFTQVEQGWCKINITEKKGWNAAAEDGDFEEERHQAARFDAQGLLSKRRVRAPAINKLL
jgi:hypothetical protein